MSYLQFAFAILVLLLTPGPTNTLLAIGAAARGFRRSLPLSLAEASAYLIVVVPLAVIAAGWLAAYPMATAVLKLAAAAWIFYLAVHLWFPQAENVQAVSFRHVFVTTLLNPKAIVIGLVIMPHGSLVEILPYLGLFTALIAGASLSWLAFGAFALGRSGVATPMAVRKVAAVVLAGFSVLLTSSLFA
jgi:threonine/homoserine/homoserine lactone efflux protein